MYSQDRGRWGLAEELLAGMMIDVDVDCPGNGV